MDPMRPAHPLANWLPRNGAELGHRVSAAVRGCFGVASGRFATAEDADPTLWETPTYSSSGESLSASTEDPRLDLYAWIAGEAGLVTGLRRFLVNEIGLHRHQVAFMGYWKRGVAMR